MSFWTVFRESTGQHSFRRSHIVSIELQKKKRPKHELLQIGIDTDTTSDETQNSNDMHSIIDDSSSQTSNSILPESITALHVALTSCILIFSIILITVGCTLPYIKTKKIEQLRILPDRTPLEIGTGFRTITLFIHAIVNCIIVSMPYIVWYKNHSCRIHDQTQKNLPLIQRTLYYRYVQCIYVYVHVLILVAMFVTQCLSYSHKFSAQKTTDTI